jgi:hypothetical protein
VILKLKVRLDKVYWDFFYMVDAMAGWKNVTALVFLGEGLLSNLGNAKGARLSGP